MPKDTARTRRLPRPLRIVRSRPRLFSSAALGAAVTVLLTAVTTWRPATRWLVGWDIGVGIYLLAVAHITVTSDIPSIRRRAGREDEGQMAILILTVFAALASLAAILALLGKNGTGDTRQPSDLILAIATIVLSWAFIHTIFALHYAHEFYDEAAGGGLQFPGGDEEPDYLDFVYFSAVIGMTSQVSDVGVTSKYIRRTVAAHGIVSFFFNVALLALMINIAASAI